MTKPNGRKPIAVEAIFAKATTTVDGGWRISFDLPGYLSSTVAEISKLRDEAIKLVIIPEGAPDSEDDL